MAAQHGHGTDTVPLLFPGPRLQIPTVGIFQGVDDQAGQEEIVCHVPLFRHLGIHLFPVAGMDLGQQCQAIFVGQAPDLLQ